MTAMMTLAAAACAPAPAMEIDVPGARRIDYAAIRDASGVLGYAEPLLGPKIATSHGAYVGKGATLVEPDVVAGAWELPPTTGTDDVLRTLRSSGVVERIRDYGERRLWVADYRAAGSPPVRLLLIDGADPGFSRRAAPEVRPGPHIYLIAYRRV